MKRYEGASVRPQALVISPEAPYPPMGGGALRTASVIDYFAKRYNIDVITFRESGAERLEFPTDRVRNVLVLDLPRHSKSGAARFARNARRFVMNQPPLVDRYSGFSARIDEWMGDRVYDLAVIEHFWCAPYAAQLRDKADQMILDLHNIESALQRTTADSGSWPATAMFRRFATAYTELEREWVPQFDTVLVTSNEDASRVRYIAPTTRVVVYPNTIPKVDVPPGAEQNAIAFSGNLEYHPNIGAVKWFGQKVWPLLHERYPTLEWRLIGKNPHAVPLNVPGMKIVGPVDDAVAALAEVKVAVVPLLAGSGTRFKILEAWAAERAVVSTTIGAEGLNARHGEHLLIADTAEDFAAAVESVLNNEDLKHRLGVNGRALYLERFTTETGWRLLESAGV